MLIVVMVVVVVVEGSNGVVSVCMFVYGKWFSGEMGLE